MVNTRELPGLFRFLLPPLFLDLQRAASEGPDIIVNASQRSSDALAVPLDRGPVHNSLQITQESVLYLSTELHAMTEREKRGGATRELPSLLRKL